ncbi:MAG TPA: DUF4105 domain-containing protein [Kofleriaceae bacterium]|nr:DUF4105 domain-containing protein [Kofleriaceae bacterium]
MRSAVYALVTALVLVALTSSAKAQPRPSDPQDYPVIELVTMGVGSLIWERHGHIALCVRYADPREDACYNYGIGDFHHPIGMATGFFRGTHSFWVGKMDPRQMLNIYRYADRTIWVQPLPLTPEQKKKVIDKLERDILEENKHYAYDHFWDNCTTRVRDVLDGATDGALTNLKGPEITETYRDLARKGFFGMRIPLLITDIAMGRVTDRVPTYFERMFLPDYMREAAERLWGVKPIAIYERKGPPPLDDGPSGRVLFALVILLLTSPAWITRLVGRFERTGLAVAILPYAFLGFVLTFLAIISPLPYVRANESCAVLIPFDILMIWFLRPQHRRLYARIRVGMVVLVGLLLLVGIFKQPIWPILLWPLVPAAVVGFWPERAAATSAAPDAKKPQGGKKKGSSRKN